MNSLTFLAMTTAQKLHVNQKRKYTGVPYATHLAEVAGLAAAAPHNYTVNLDVVICVAWLHDSIEDQNATHGALASTFGDMVADGVLLLSDMENVGNRAERKAASRARLAAAPGWVQTIKCADLISNTSSIVQHDPEFAKVYLEEKRLLLDVMTRAEPGMLAMARILSVAA